MKKKKINNGTYTKADLANIRIDNHEKTSAGGIIIGLSTLVLMLMNKWLLKKIEVVFVKI